MVNGLGVDLEMDTKKTCVKKILEFVQNMLITLGSMVSFFLFFGGEDVYDHSMSTRIFTLIMNRMFTRAP